jgi:putative chitinase
MELKMRSLTLSDFQSCGWHVNDQGILALVNGILMIQDEVFARYGITEDLHIVHLMAQLSHECGEGGKMTESLNYTPAALLKQWPSHFTPAQAMACGRTEEHPANQKMIGELAYGGRMGNAPAPSEDGYNYRGRGLIQTTGKAGYAELAKLIDLDLVNSPELVNEPAHAFVCAVAEFVHYPRMLAHCEADNLLAVSSLINVGHLVNNPNDVAGYQDRAAQLRLWKHQYGF